VIVSASYGCVASDDFSRAMRAAFADTLSVERRVKNRLVSPNSIRSYLQSRPLIETDNLIEVIDAADASID
jgi:hypothetical protein